MINFTPNDPSDADLACLASALLRRKNKLEMFSSRRLTLKNTVVYFVEFLPKTTYNWKGSSDWIVDFSSKLGLPHHVYREIGMHCKSILPNLCVAHFSGAVKLASLLSKFALNPKRLIKYITFELPWDQINKLQTFWNQMQLSGCSRYHEFRNSCSALQSLAFQEAGVLPKGDPSCSSTPLTLFKRLEQLTIDYPGGTGFGFLRYENPSQPYLLVDAPKLNHSSFVI